MYTLKRPLIIASRNSPLALKQAELVLACLRTHYPELPCKIIGISTEADRKQSSPITEFGGKGSFVKELEDALLNGKADLAVHSMKDVPMTLPDSLLIASMLTREDPRDVIILREELSYTQLSSKLCLATSSLRRELQLKARYPELQVSPIRGNIGTRLALLASGKYDGIVLAAAGLKRLELTPANMHLLSPADMLPAAGQGAIGIECRADDAALLTLLAPCNDATTAACVNAERAFCRALHGGCHLPIAAYAAFLHVPQQIHLEGFIASYSHAPVYVTEIGPLEKAEAIGHRAALALYAQGADIILREFL